MAWKVSVAPVKALATAKGIKNPAQLARCAGISRHTAKRWWNDDPTMLYIDKPTLVSIARCLEASAGELIIITEE